MEVPGGELAVHGETKTRKVGHFDYRMSLPADADTGRISAGLSHGVLTVRIPRQATGGKPHRIEITNR